MKSKKILFVLLCGVLLFVLTGCINRKAATMDDYKKVTEEAGLEFEKVGDSSEGEMGTASSDKLEIMSMFYIYEDANSAKADYLEATEDLETKSQTTVTIGNYERIDGILRIDDESLTDYDYFYMARIDNTILIFSSKSERKSKIKEMAKQLGY